MTNNNPPPTKNPPPVGGPILDLIWESPPAGGISRDSPHRGGFTPSYYGIIKMVGQAHLSLHPSTAGIKLSASQKNT